jgi:hypothetical protein
MCKSGKTDARYRDYIELGCVVLCVLCPDRSVESSFVFIYYIYESKRQRTPTSRYTSPYLILGPADIALY